MSHRALMPIDPSVPEETMALRVFCAWARGLPKAPKDPSDLVKSITPRRRYVGRLVTKVRGRRLRLRQRPYGGRERPRGVPDVSRIDPWNPPADLMTWSRHIVDCETCDASGKVACGRCGGEGRLRCENCGGDGRVTKFDARGKLRRMNCGECRGKGTTACESCHRGNLECPTCARAKRLECWWEVTGGDRDVDVQVEPDGEETAAFSWGQDGIEATPEEVTADARLVYTIRRDRAIVADELPREISLEWQARHWVALQAKLDAGERIVAQELSYLEVPSVTIRYATARDAQTISLEGRRFLAPPLRDDRILHQRAASLGVWQVLLGIPPLLLLVLYAARGSYFLTGTLAAMGGAAAVLSICAYRWLWSRGLARRVGRLVPVLSGAALGALAVMGIFIEPSRATAGSLLSSGDLQGAEREIDALGERGSQLRDQLAFARFERADSLDARREQYKGISPASPHHPRARATLAKQLLDDAQRRLGAGDLKGARQRFDERAALRVIDAELDDTRRELLVAEANRCIDDAEWRCAYDRVGALGNLPVAVTIRARLVTSLRTRAQHAVTEANLASDLSARVEAQRRAEAAHRDLMVVEPGDPPSELVAMRKRAGMDLAALEKRQQAEAARVEKEQRRQAEREARAQRDREAEEAAARKREEREVRSRGASTIMCCDGTRSPTCGCNRNSFRGCCSHHGGICGGCD